MVRLTPRRAKRATGDWLPMICGLTIVTLFIVAKVALSLDWLATWQPLQGLVSSGHADVLSLVALALAVGLLMRLTQIRAQQRIDAVELSQRKMEALLSENAAVVRACRAVAREFAQPLTGALAYSELLVADATYTSESQRHEVEGLREGVLRMECLLRCLRDAVSDAAAASVDRSIADDIEYAVGLSLPRRVFRREA